MWQLIIEKNYLYPQQNKNGKNYILLLAEKQALTGVLWQSRNCRNTNTIEKFLIKQDKTNSVHSVIESRNGYKM